MPLGKKEAQVVEIAERVSSVVSVLGAFFIIGTFLLDRRFRKPINRLVFYASWGNLLANVATLISRSGIKLGVNAPLCQFQAFLIQWFMPADALWTFAMACNVFLTFFRQYDAAALRTLEWRYVTLCYGVPFIPAFVFCFIETAERGKFYGSANLWCWVSTDWNAFRIATFYAPVWVIIITNMVIYVKVGSVVLRWRRQLLSLNKVPNSRPRRSTVTLPMSGMRSPTTKTYEVRIVSQVPHQSAHDSTHLSVASPTMPNPGHASFQSAQTCTEVESNAQRRTTIVHPVSLSGTNRIVDVNKATLSYCYTALLFFIALLVTWVPSSTNRLFGVIHPDATAPFGLDFSSGLVLPLQGFWNTVIYIVTSWEACKAIAGDLRNGVSYRANSVVSQPERYGISSRMKRDAASLGSDDTTDCESNAQPKAKFGHDSKSSHTLTEIFKSPRKSAQSSRNSIRSPRADIVISFDGKRRVIHHDKRGSVLEPCYNPFDPKERRRRSNEWVPPLSEEDEKNQTRLYESEGPSRSSLHFDTHGETIDVDSDSDNSDDEKRRDSNIGFAK